MRIFIIAFACLALVACAKPPKPSEGLEKVKVISNGPAIKEADYKIPGHVVLLSFHSDS